MPYDDVQVRRSRLITLGLVLNLMGGLVPNLARARADYNMPSPDARKTTYDPGGESRMERLAGPREVERFLKAYPRDFYVFCEDRTNPTRRYDALPAHWLEDGETYLEKFRGTAQPGEFYVFQLAVYSPNKRLENLSLSFPDLKGKTAVGADRFRCFDLGGVDYAGRAFRKKVDVAQGRVQPLWIGLEIPRQASGVYRGTIRVQASGAPPAEVGLSLKVSGPALQDHGDGDAGRLSRLRWLDSTIGFDDDIVTAPFVPLNRKGRVISLLGRELALTPNGLPAGVESFFSPGNTKIGKEGRAMLADPFKLVVETGNGVVEFKKEAVRFTRVQKGAIEWTADSDSADFGLAVKGLVEFDGYVSVSCRLKAKRPMELRDVRLEMAFVRDCTAYFMGLGQRGGYRPESLDWKWNKEYNQDGFWIGGVNAGMKVRFKGANYRTPLINCYYHFQEINVPESWGNDGKGGIRMSGGGDGKVLLTSYSGARSVAAGEELAFDFDLYLTPFKTLDTEGQWHYRYYHPGGGMEDEDLRQLSRIKEKGANVVNIHHAKEQNPTINYPYFAPSFPLLKKCVRDAHRQGIKVKIYYTTREITNNLPELWAFHSLDGEVIFPGPGRDAKPLTNRQGPHPWLVEHLRERFIPAWSEVLGGRYGGRLDLAVITTPDSRLDNFYLEGLAYTVRNAGIDGLYVDDTALGRKAFQRARRILDAHDPDSQIDMHSWSHFNEPAGFTPSAYQYLGNFPYYNRIWFGEGFSYDATPDFWLVEMSGIPFGLMGEMLQGGGNPWRGMVYGMTARLPWSGDPRPLWRVWDDFGMAGTEMIGYWADDRPVRTGRDDILVTVYSKKGKALLALASWSEKEEKVRLEIDWSNLGMAPSKARLHAPAIAGFQPQRSFAPDEDIPVEAGKGWLLVLEK